MLDPDRLDRAYRLARDALLAERVKDGYWVGELSSSALSTATAVSALAVASRHAGGSSERQKQIDRLIAAGLRWLAGHQNSDGGWGDTDRSLSNIATTLLGAAAMHLAGAVPTYRGVMDRAWAYVESHGGVPAVRQRYGHDKTFSVPILANAAIAGLVDWREATPLPFELVCLPRNLWGWLRLPVVSYAIPALVAIGQARFAHAPPHNPLVRWVRRWAAPRSLTLVQQLQPASGGFLEATPLTSFVVMSLASIGQGNHPIVQRGMEFLIQSARPDGSWPIDTNLATWVTTLAVNALAVSDQDVAGMVNVEWLLECQHQRVDPMTGTGPGGWGWTDRSGAVPDADDTAGALLALAAIRRTSPPDLQARIEAAAALGLDWLLRLQNRDGGWPTFCRGWGALPFDRSGVDLTAHALRALYAWKDCPAVAARVPNLRTRSLAALGRGLHYLACQQHEDGRFVPLWFGNQYHPDEENPIYGTARVLLAYRDLGLMWKPPAQRAVAWLAAQCDPHGGWGSALASPERGGGVSSVEETAVAVEALWAASDDPSVRSVAERGVTWLVEAVETGGYRQSQPIGFYFAKLWYYEKLYGLIFTVSALSRAIKGWPVADPAGRVL